MGRARIYLTYATVAVALAAPRARAQDFDPRRPAEPARAPAPKLTKPPRLLEPPRPIYPPEALARGLAADVTLQLDVDATGAVTAVAVTRAAGDGFDEAAQDAAARLRFEPAEIDGRPAPIRIDYTLHFRPQAPAPLPLPPPAAPPPPPPPPPVAVRGRVREKGTRDPVAGADVAVQILTGADGASPSEIVATTDGDGRFEARGRPGDRLRVAIFDGEHEPCLRDVTAGATPVEIVCTVAVRSGKVLESIVRAPRDATEITRHTLEQRELRTVPGTFGDPLRVVQNLPGIARTPYGLGLLVIRGASPQDSGVFVDGHKVPLLYHFLGGPSVLTPELIDRIDFYPGGFGVRYGRVTAGVIDVGTRTQPVKATHGSAKIDVLDSAFYVESPVTPSTTAGAAGRRSYVDLLLPLVLDGRTGSTSVVASPVYWDYQARATLALGRWGQLALFAFGSDDTLKVVAQNPDLGKLELGSRIGFHRLIATWTAELRGWTSRLSPSYGYDLAGFDAGQVDGTFGAHVLGLREDLERRVTSTLKLGVGFDGELRFDGLDLNAPLPPLRRTYGRADRDVVHQERSLADLGSAVYAEALWDPHPRVRIVPGVRVDWFHYAGEDRASVDPRVVVRWARSSRQAFKIGAGIFHQPPAPWQLDALIGNPRLSLLWADQYHAGIEQAFTEAIALDATAYYLRRHDQPIASARLDASRGRPENFASEGVGRAYGLELRLRHAVTRNFYGWISYTLSRSEAISTLRADPSAPPPVYAPTQFDQTHNLIVVASRRIGAWEVGTRFRLVTGVPETPILGASYDADFNGYDSVRGATGSTRRQTFHQLDLRAERTWTFDAWRLSAYLDVQNVYNAQNPEATIYDYRFRASAPVRGLPILPTLGVRGSF